MEAFLTQIWPNIFVILVITYFVVGYRHIRKLVDDSQTPISFGLFIILVCIWTVLFIIDWCENVDFKIYPRKKE